MAFLIILGIWLRTVGMLSWIWDLCNFSRIVISVVKSSWDRKSREWTICTALLTALLGAVWSVNSNWGFSTKSGSAIKTVESNPAVLGQKWMVENNVTEAGRKENSSRKYVVIVLLLGFSFVVLEFWGGWFVCFIWFSYGLCFVFV